MENPCQSDELSIAELPLSPRFHLACVQGGNLSSQSEWRICELLLSPSSLAVASENIIINLIDVKLKVYPFKSRKAFPKFTFFHELNILCVTVT